MAELRRLGWNEAVVKQKRKGDAGKMALAQALRAGTTMPLAWIAARLAMGSRVSGMAVGPAKPST